MVNFSSFDNPFTRSLLISRKMLKENESIPDLFHRVVTALVQEEKTYGTSEKKIEELANQFTQALSDRIISLGSPILTNAGMQHQPLSACTVIPVDLSKSLKEISKVILPYYLANIGSGFNFSKIEDPISKIREINQYFSSIDSKVERPACGMATLRVDHPLIEEFIVMKRDEDFSLWRFNLSVEISDNFMEAVKSNQKWILQNGKEVSAKELFHKIIESAHYCGEPGILFMDRHEADNPIPTLPYESVSPCAEIALAPGEVCQFSYLNLEALLTYNTENHQWEFDFEKLQKNTKLLTRILDNAVDISIKNAVAYPEKIAAKRKIGIGICGFADMLLKLKIPYASTEAEDLLSRIVAVINYSSKEISIELNEIRGPFLRFDDSRYKDPKWVARFKEFPTKEISIKKWEELAQMITTKKIRNAGTVSLPPTGVSARIIQTSTSIEPLFSLLNYQGAILPIVRQYLSAEWDQIHLPEQERNRILQMIENRGYLPENTENVSLNLQRIFQVAQQILPENQIRMIGCAQRHADEGIAKTINCKKTTTVDEMERISLMAYENKLKGITFFRDGCLEERKKSAS